MLCLGIHGTAMAQSLSVSDVEVLPGTTGSYELAINVGSGEYTGFQYEIAFPATGFSTPDVEKSTVNTSWAGGTINPGALKAGAGKVSAVSMSNAKLPTGDYAVGTVAFEVDSDVPVGEYNVTISNIEFLSGTTRTPADDVTFKIKVVEKLTVVLDELSMVAPVAATDVNVRVKRTLKANSWNTICLPFAMSEAQTKSVFGDDVKLKDFTGAETTNDAGDNVVGITMKFTDATAIEANHPYLIKVSSAISEFTADGVDIEPEDEPSIDKDEYRTGSGTKKDPYVYHYNSFVGNYVAETAVPEYCLFISNDKFYYSDGSTKMKAFRGYFDLYDVLTSVEDASAHINIIDGDATGISDVRTYSVDNNSYYDLQGRKVENPKKGLYIINNKKVVIK